MRVQITGVTVADVERMTAKLYVTGGDDRRTKWSAFWTLLVLAAVIASAGVVADSTATVIGAMIVAPLMTPILGSALAIVLVDRRKVLDNLGLVVVGSALVIVVGFAVGLMHLTPVLASNNSQVAGRVSPTLIDLLAALATGAVGAFALVRSDVSDTLPGVAIAISLVPPLAVVGITLESGAPHQSLGALLLFGTNVAAIIATGTGVLLLFRIREVARGAGMPVGRLTGRTLVVIAGMVVLIAVPLTYGSVQVVTGEKLVGEARPVAARWAQGQGWRLTDVTYSQDRLQIKVLGSGSQADAASLRAALDSAGLAEVDADVELVNGTTQSLPSD